MDDFQALHAAGLELEKRLIGLSGDAMLQRPSRCEGWTVRELVNHVIGGGHRYLLRLRGAPKDEVKQTRDLDYLLPEPLGAHLHWQIRLGAEFAEPGALERLVVHPAGRRSGHHLLQLRVLELAVHAWDLGRSLGEDADLDPELVDYLLTTCMRQVDELRPKGYFAPVRAGSLTPARGQARLLALTGRA